MAKKKLLVVESPTKVKTISKFLGIDFVIKASKGHVKDLPQNSLGVDIEHDFKPTYRTIKGKERILKEIREAAKNSEEVYLAPDPDREGEAIAWHIAQDIKKHAEDKPLKRAVFHEITKRAVTDAIKHPRELDENLFNAQQARRILDRLVGYKLSPLLWKKVKRGLSAGRVQSVAVKIVCEREKEIQNFIPEEYWTITALLNASQPPEIKAILTKIDGKKAKVSNDEEAKKIKGELENSDFIIEKVEKKRIKRNPLPPFITSRLQQEASRRFGFTAKKTMMLAQRLYEGVDIGNFGSVGLITYMRTDSVRTADEAISMVREYIKNNYGEDFLPAQPNRFKNKNSAQDAHEAIRPTSTQFTPDLVKKYLDSDRWKLYKLIWDRFVASQMPAAEYDQTTITIKAGKYTLTASGKVLKFAGYLKVYNDQIDEKDQEQTFPPVKDGEKLQLKRVELKQNFTKPPPRYTEGSLVRALEEKEIGRPSTYATIISTIQEREYVKKEKNFLTPTDLGFLITELLDKSFPEIMDEKFTAEMEKRLDLIEEGKRNWVDDLKEFYQRFEKDIEKAQVEMKDVKKEGVEVTDEKCPICGAPLVIRYGKYGKFLACSNYPKCKYTRPLPEEIEYAGEICPKCGGRLIVKRGKGGVRFIACENYPKCDYTKPYSLGIKCPKCREGEIVEKVSAKGKIFYSCSRYPDCDFAVWDEPVDVECSNCGYPILVKKRKGKSYYYQCPNCKATFSKEEIQKKLKEKEEKKKG